MPEDELVPQVLMRRMLYGSLLSRALCVLAELEIPEFLSGGPQSAAELAKQAGVDHPSLLRLLRAVTAFEVVTEKEPEVFALTELGRTLRADAPASALPTARLVGTEIGDAWMALGDTVRTGRPAFDLVHGRRFFDYLEEHPSMRAVFDQSQSADLALEAGAILRSVAFAAGQTVVDVAGGDGALLELILSAFPGLRGILLDLPSTVALALRRLTAAGLGGRCRFVAGDFFRDIPAGADVYLMRQIMHDWPDEDCRLLLENCRRAMAPGARLVIVERVTGEESTAPAEERIAALMDLYMMAVLGGRERTRAEFVDLLTTSGFADVHTYPLAGSSVAFQTVGG